MEFERFGGACPGCSARTFGCGTGVSRCRGGGGCTAFERERSEGNSRSVLRVDEEAFDGLVLLRPSLRKIVHGSCHSIDSLSQPPHPRPVAGELEPDPAMRRLHSCTGFEQLRSGGSDFHLAQFGNLSVRFTKQGVAESVLKRLGFAGVGHLRAAQTAIATSGDFDLRPVFSNEGILKSIDRRSARQRNLFSRVNASDGFEEWIVSQKLRVVPVRIAHQNLVHLLDDDPFRRMSDDQLRTRIRQPPSCFRENSQLLIKLANRQQPRIRNDLLPVKSDSHLLPIEREIARGTIQGAGAPRSSSA